MKLNEESNGYETENYLELNSHTDFDTQAILEEYKNGNIFGKQVPF